MREHTHTHKIPGFPLPLSCGVDAQSERIKERRQEIIIIVFDFEIARWKLYRETEAIVLLYCSMRRNAHCSLSLSHNAQNIFQFFGCFDNRQRESETLVTIFFGVSSVNVFLQLFYIYLHTYTLFTIFGRMPHSVHKHTHSIKVIDVGWESKRQRNREKENKFHDDCYS